LFDNINDSCGHKTKEYHCGNREIKFKILPFYAYITGQTSDPMQLIMKEINNYPENDNQTACKDDVFTGIAVHIAKV
jgi:hypothetical protein